jgi:hypothetical protein
MRTNIKNWRAISAVTVLLFSIGVSSCGGSTASPQTATSTIPLDPTEEFLAMRKSSGALDGSYISVSPTGMYGLLITEVPGSEVPNYEEWQGGVATHRKVTLYQWKSPKWVDVSESAPPIDPEQSATEVTTRDYNMDSVNDFLISFWPYGGMRPYGKILTNISGQWLWADFLHPDGSLSQDSDAMGYDDETKKLWGQTFLEGRTSVVWEWNKRGYFTANPEN